VGEAEDIQKRLLEHIRGDNPCITERQPTAFIFELADADHRVARRNELIGEYDPTCNK